MNILRKFTIQNLKLNKKRTIVTIIGIMLSTALICAVAGMVSSTQETLIETMKTSKGDYHATFKQVPKSELQSIEENKKIASYFLTRTLGYAKATESKNESKPYYYVMEYDKMALQKSAFTIIEGRMPENSNEIVISKHIIDNAKIDLKIGDSITLDIGTRQLTDGTALEQSNSYLEEKNKEGMEEEIVNAKSKIYQIVGIIERPSYLLEGFSAPGYTMISYLENTENIAEANISITYENPKDFDEETAQILKTIKNNTGIEIEKTVNSDLLRFQGALGEATLKVLYGIATVVILIIVVSSVFVIRNSFSISVSEKTKQYGMLTSIGATKKQISKTVLLEGLFIGLIAIPLGIILGIVAINILIIIVNYLLGDMLNGTSFIYSVPILPIVLSAIISSITIYLSCMIPAKRAAKISPIEAIRGNSDIKIKAKKLKTTKLTKKLFGIGGVIASKNLKRNKKKYRTTVISLVVSISIFISLSSFLEYGKKMTGMYYMDMDYNVTVSSGTKELYQEIMKLDNIKQSSYSYITSAILDVEKYGTEYGKKLNATYGDEDRPSEGSISVIALNNEYFDSFAKELGINEKDLKNVVILEDDLMRSFEDGSRKVENFYHLNTGDTFTLKIKGTEREVKITKKSDIRPMGYEQSYADGGWLFVSEDFLQEQEKNYVSSLNIEASDATKLENKLTELKSQNESYANINVTNYEAYLKQEQRLILLISIFLYGFIAVITLIGVTNIFNTITTNMILRSKEFANLKSVGMTSKEFNKMIRLESILYGLKSLLIGIPIGLFGSYAIYYSFANAIDFGFIFPWQSILISIIFVFVIVGLTMRYSLNKINKQNIIDTIRQDNI
ncbi:MAG: FtsX-like permease family protein [Clostridia bacterium]|nr:FtsX-like permease family protein [Clostridia bacterium]